MRWEKKGLIFEPKHDGGWMSTYAMLPTPYLMNDRLRIYIGFCADDNIGRIGYVDVNPDNPSEIIEISKKPVLDIGGDGCFDDHGVVPVSLLARGDTIYLYYIGFMQGVKVPYYMFCGLATSCDGQNFKRVSQTPILDRYGDELYARCGVFVFEDREVYRIYYIGSVNEGWTVSQGELKPLYSMQYLESKSATDWNGIPYPCMHFQSSDEHGFGRPFVWKEKDIYRMLYSVRTYTRGYYIGYAESTNGKDWIRKDNLAGISLSEKGSWDDTNLSYPCLFRYNQKTYMFYNGNGCGKSGFGYAELVDN